MSAHPLDPLTKEEIEAAAETVLEQAGLHESAWFETITLDEPAKETSKDQGKFANIPRTAYVCCYEPSSNRTFTGKIDASKRALLEWKHIQGVQARIVPDEFTHGESIIKQDKGFQDALAKRGITDLDTVLVETWSAGNFGEASEEGERIAYCYCWHVNDAGDNRYGRPIANLHPVYDQRRQKIVRIDDFGIEELPPDSSSIRPDTGLRKDLKPLEITQPDGPSFEVDGYGVRWQKWNLRIGYDLREGLVLHQIGYEDDGNLRPIMHRVSMAEMVVPYGDPRPGQFRRNAFDTGEYGIGQALDSLKLGCDCLGYIHYFDVWTHDWRGKPREIKHAVCMHEEDFGILWKHTDSRTGKSRVVRSRRLVISSLCTIGNYVYGFFYYFYQDGTIGIEVKATGIPFPSGIEKGKKPEFGNLIAPGIDSHVHQHVFSFRFDMCVDGPKNSVREVEFEAMPLGKDNPNGNGIRIVDRLLKSEKQAQRTLNMATSRYWKVSNENTMNYLGKPVAYKLVAGANTLPLLDDEAPVAKRAQFMFKHFWATQFHPDERFPAGWFPNQSMADTGLPEWTKNDRSLENKDIVVWYTLNFHHLPRPEDWPVQPVVYANFHWMPDGFFRENPSLDVPPGKV